jgi:Polyketide synthase dehydratase
MSLAIEALLQIKEARGLTFDGVTLRDIDIKKALVIPDNDDGIEIQLRLHQLAESSETAGWYEFAVESIQERQWILHCEGRIATRAGIVKAEEDHMSPVKVSKLTQRVPGKRWYDAFSRVGFDYQNSFQQLQRVRTNRHLHEAAADVAILNECGLMQGESRYLIHPATFDACLQLIIISIHAGAHKEMPWGVVPIKIDEVSISLPGDDLESVGRAIAWTDRFEDRYFNTHTKLMGTSGNLIMDVNNLRCVAYEAAVPPTASGKRPSQPYMETVWKPDISSLSESQLAEQCHGLVATEVIQRLIMLLDHKHGLKNILLLGRPSQSDLERLLQAVPATASITLGYTTAEEMESEKHLDEAYDRISTVFLPENTDKWNEIFPSNNDSLTIVQEGLVRDIVGKDALKAIRAAIGERSRLITSSTSALCKSIVNNFFSADWSVTQVSTGADMTVLLCDARPYTNGVYHGEQEIKMLSVDGEAPEDHELVKALTAAGICIRVKPISEFDASDDLKVILPNNTCEVLMHRSSKDFEALRRILCASGSKLWLTRGVNEGRSADGGMVEGFLRVIRSEQPGVQIALLDFDSDEDVSVIADAITAKLDAVASKDSGDDTEFWLHDSILHVNRISPNQDLNKIAAGLSLAPETQVLDANSHLSGTVENGQVHFKQLPLIEPVQLNSGEVEVQVNCSDLQRKIDEPTLVMATVIRVGPNVGSFFLGKEVVAYALRSLSTIIRTSVWAYIKSDTDRACLLSSLKSLTPAVNATFRAAGAKDGDRVLLLPGPLSVIRSIVHLSRVFHWAITVVFRNSEEKQMYINDLGLSAEAVLPAYDVKAICNLLQKGGSVSPNVVIAHDFSMLSKEAWRCIMPLGRFILNEASINNSPDLLPFSRGATFLATNVSNLVEQDKEAARNLLKLAASTFLTYQQYLTIDPAAQDVGEAKLPSVQDAENGLITYDYGKSLVQVCPLTLPLKHNSYLLLLLDSA